MQRKELSFEKIKRFVLRVERVIMTIHHRPRRDALFVRVVSMCFGLFTLLALCGCLGGGGSGSGTAGTGTLEDTASIERTVGEFLAALRNPSSSLPASFLSQRFQSLSGVGGFTTLQIRSFGTDIANPADDDFLLFVVDIAKIVYLSGTLAQVPASTQFPDGQRLQLVFSLVKEDTRWLIDFIEIAPFDETASQMSDNPANSAALWPLGPGNRWRYLETTAGTANTATTARFRQFALASFKQTTSDGLAYYDMPQLAFTGRFEQTSAVFGLDSSSLEFAKDPGNPEFTDGGFFPLSVATPAAPIWNLLDPSGNGTFQLANALGIWLNPPGAPVTTPWWKLSGLLAIPGARLTQTLSLSDAGGSQRDVELKALVMPSVVQTLPWMTARATRIDVCATVAGTGETGLSTLLFIPGLGPSAYGAYDNATRRLTRVGYLLEADVNGRTYRSTKPAQATETLSLLTTQPIDGAVGIPSFTPLLMTFDASLEPTSVASQVTAVSGSTVLSGILTASDTILRFAPLSGWPAGQRIDVTIGTGVRSLTGLTLPAPLGFGFTTALPGSPIAVPDAYLLLEDTPLTVTVASGVLANDVSPEGQALQAMAGSAPAHASMTLNPNGSLSCQPEADYFGTDTFTYQAQDSFGSRSATGTVTLDIVPVNDPPILIAGTPPVASQDTGLQLLSGWATLSPGPANEASQTLQITLTASPATLLTTLYLSPSGDLSFAPASGASGIATVTTVLRDSGGTANGGIDTRMATFTVSVQPISVPASPSPQILSIAPSIGTNTAPLTPVILTGTGFQTGATVHLASASFVPVQGTGVSVTASTSLTCTLDLTGLATGTWDIGVTNPDGKMGTGANLLTIVAPIVPPSVTAIAPTAAPASGTAVLSITGTGFQPSVLFRLTMPGQTPISSLLSTNTTSLATASFDLAGVITGSWFLEAVNPDGGSATTSIAFAVTTPISSPVISAIAPASASASGSVTLNVAGSGFLDGAAFRLTQTGQTPINSDTSTNTASLATASFTLTGAPTGSWYLEVINPDSGSYTSSLPFSITVPPPSAPIVAVVSPTYATNTAPIQLTVTGSNFYGAPTVRLSHPTLATLTAVPDSVTPSSLLVTFDLTSVPSGTRILTVANPDGQVSSDGVPLDVNDPLPPAIVSAFSPLSARGETTTTITVLGDNLAATTSVRLVATGQADIPGTSVTVSGSTTLTATFDLTGAATGTWSLVLLNTGAVETVASTAFTVARPFPVITSVTPTGAPNTGITNLTLAGNYFTYGMKAVLIGSAGERFDEIYHWNSVFNGSTYSCSFDLAGKPLQTMSVYVFTYDFDESYNPIDEASNAVPLPFEVRSLASPTITSLSVDQRPLDYESNNITLDLYGSDFVSGASVQFYTTGATDTPTVYFNSSQNLHVAFIPSIAPPATYSIRVINPSGDVATYPGTFFFEPPPPLPTITAITPNVIWNDAGKVNLQVDGTGFADTPYTSAEFATGSYSAGIEGKTTFESSTRVYVEFNFNYFQPATWTLQMRNPYQYPANPASFTVLASAPTITSVEPASGASNLNVAVSIYGTNLFGYPPPNIRLASAGYADIPANSVNDYGTTRVDCAFDLSSYYPATGTWDLLFTNFDGRTASAPFLITDPLP